jgi:hypothetical protein
MESLRISKKREEKCHCPPRQRLGQITATCWKKALPDKTNVLESQRIINERCPEIFIDGVAKKQNTELPLDQRTVSVRTQLSSETTGRLKDAIQQVQDDIRFYEYFKPQPLPPDWLIVPRERNNAGDPQAPNRPCQPGEIRRFR